MRITIHISNRPRRPKPKVGDRRVIRGVEHIRVFKMATDMLGRAIGYDCTGGRQRFEWVPVSEARAHRAEHHWTDAERAKYGSEYPAGYMQQRGAA
ncbi:hypothetical protein [Burkholderia pseudomallei]|uniref:hypothetical protein n=1 Tax=Burkholderia pseudomallei TaxID=28450 RepID=UPI000F06529B|nr:hypothetical protein [Burkholderia pseudomallei]MWA16526.1 hypothetical protein [Burkholderia pseudomallei]VBQ81345.1 Uncharacterised protein [Burkholderia pseudomallei]